jgi:LPPG:FO 2-phospho-L-lactate transferase
MIVALCGGVGGSKLVVGLYKTLPPDSLTVVVNTADDLKLWGLNISPDLDTVSYTLAGIARRDVGWGIEDDTFHALEMLARFGLPAWFRVGDRDLATDIFRTHELRRGRTLSAITADICSALAVRAHVVPMTDSSVSTRLLVDSQWLNFQDYFVRRRHSDPVDAVQYGGIEHASPAPSVVDSITQAECIVLVNSNPVLSILPILAVPGLREAIAHASCPRVAVSPIVGTDAVTGPAGELMRLLGHPSSATGVAEAYQGLIDGLIIDVQDRIQERAIRDRGLAVLCTDTLMRNEQDRVRLASEAIGFARSLS